MSRLRALHQLGEDPAYERFPALKQPKDSQVDVIGEAAVLRATLWQYLRERAEAGQLKAIEDGRVADVPWQHFTGALCVASPQGAYQKARRLKAEQVREPGERRTPEVARRALALAAEFAFQERPKIPDQIQRSRAGNSLKRERGGLICRS